jgi:hypothetical protein
MCTYIPTRRLQPGNSTKTAMEPLLVLDQDRWE